MFTGYSAILEFLLLFNLTKALAKSITTPISICWLLYELDVSSRNCVLHGVLF